MAEPTTWYVLQHRPGPAVGQGADVSEHQGIREHYAFLRRRLEDGTLVAAGPLEAGSGEGMTILATGSLQKALQLAEQDDQSVVAGVLSVSVRPWQVVMAPRLPH